MKPQMHLVILSLINLALLISGLGIYRYIYPKKRIKFVIVLLLLSFLPIVSIFRPGSYESGDLSLHATRAMSFYNVLTQEHTIPKWSPELNLGYGDAYFEFIYFFPYLLISIIHSLGIDFLNSVKIVISLAYILSGQTFFLFVKKILGEKSALIGAIFYLFAPYHLVDLHFRVTIAEIISFAIIPLLFYYAFQLGKKGTTSQTIFLSIVLSFQLLTHQIIFLTSLPFLTVFYIYTVYRLKNREKIRRLISLSCAFFTSALLTGFHWIPILFEAKYIYQSLPTYKGVIMFTPFEMILFSPWRYGLLFQGHFGELSFIIGYTQLFVIILAVYQLSTNKLKKNVKILTSLSIICLAILILMMLKFSEPLWDIIPLINNIQFTYRLLLVISFITSLLAAIVFKDVSNKKILFLISFLTISYTILNWGNRKNIPQHTDTYLKNQLLYGPTVTGDVEPTAPIWVNPNKVSFTKRPAKHIEIVSGAAEIQEIKRSPYRHIYSINTDSQSKFKENTFFFPGWQLKVNNQLYPFNYTDKNFPGIINFKLPEGKYNVEISFNPTLVRKVAFLISIVSIISLGLYVLLKKFKRYYYD